MPTWNPAQYLQFNDQRTRPCRELAARIAAADPRRVIDLGCGPGNSTAVLAERWPGASLLGVDSSAEMIASARKAMPNCQWRTADIAAWADEAGEKFDIVFSNAAMQWVSTHAQVFAKLMKRVESGGVLAAQMPGNWDAAAHRLMRELAGSAEWLGRFPEGGVREWHVHELAFYYDVLAPVAATVDLWETEYLHILPDARAIVEWYKGTGLRPFLDALKSEKDRELFLAEYLEKIRQAYPSRADGKVIFPFRRLFIIAYREMNS